MTRDIADERMDRTLSDVLGGPLRPSGSCRPVVDVLMRVEQPSEPSSRHAVDDIDVVQFGRGPRAAIRDTVDGLRRLILRVPDPWMSSDHGRLVLGQGRWVLEDTASKNGVVVRGRSTRCAPLVAGDRFELGHTVFAVGVAALPTAAAPDRVADALPAPTPDLVTFHAELAGHVDTIRRLAATDVSILFFGETGTGKEIYA